MKSTYLLIALLTLSMNAIAEVKIEAPWIRSTQPGQQVAGGYMTITSDTEKQLVGGVSALAEAVEVHEMRMQGDIMKMRRLDKITIKPGEPLVLKPGGYHLMLTNIRKQMKDGDHIPITLKFANTDGTESQIYVVVPVKDPGSDSHQNHNH